MGNLLPSLSETSNIPNLARISYLNINGNSIVKQLLPDTLKFFCEIPFYASSTHKRSTL
jgi:hypothetical protein